MNLTIAPMIGAFALVLGPEAPVGPGPLPVAHRGLIRHAPEDTLANFRACLELRLGFEFDVRRSADGVLVCVHDETVDRTTDGTGAVSGLTVEELKAMDAGSWFDPAFAGERIPTFEEVLDLLSEYEGPPVLVAVDLKVDDPGLAGEVVAMAKERGVIDRLLFIGLAIGDESLRRRLAEADPAAEAARLAESPEEFEAALGDDSAAWVYVRYLAEAEEVRRAHEAGKRVFIAGPTVAGREPGNWRRASEAGLDAVLTDYPLDLRAELRGDRPGSR